MNFFQPWLPACSLVIALFCIVCVGQIGDRDLTKDEPYYQQLQKAAPKAVESFKAATLSLDSGDADAAAAGFNDVLKQVPNFEPAMRRLGYALAATGKRAEGMAMCQKAVDLNRSPENLIGLATATIGYSNPTSPPNSTDLQKAFSLVNEAAQKNPDGESLTYLADISLRIDRIDDFNKTVDRLLANFPDMPTTHYFNAIKVGDAGNFDKGIAEAKLAAELGMPEEETSQLISALEKARDEAYPLAQYSVYIYAFIGVIVLWGSGLLALYLLGKSFSTRTLKLLEESDANDVTGGGHAGLKASYRRLITFAGIYYYASQPVVIALVVVATAGLIYGFFMIGRIPIVFVLGLIFVGAWSIYSLLKSMIFRPKVEDPGRVLAENEAPKLWELVRQVGADVNTRTIDEIRMTPGSELAVYERGSFRKKMNDQADRVLILGVASFNDFSTNAFRAVLAHEYGHFSNRDTAGGDIAFRVNTDLIHTAESIVSSGANTYHNLAFHFLRLYHFIFRRITHGSSRLQEVLADRVAIHKYGAAAFREGLEHVIRQEIAFNAVAGHEVNVAISQHRPINNLYSLPAPDDQILSDIERETQELLNAPTTEDDTHPSPIDRFRHAEKITAQTAVDVSGQVWDLFEDREGMTQSMSVFLEERVRAIRFGSPHDVLS